jgi:HNH endonuclease
MKRRNGQGSVYWVEARKRWALAVVLPSGQRKVLYGLTREDVEDVLPAEPLEQYFWRHVEKTDTCWLWRGRTTQRYGQFMVAGRLVLAHRFAWELANGRAPDDLYVCHRCDTPLCVRLDHLFVSTAAGNTADMIAKGRSSNSQTRRQRRIAGKFA